MRALNKLFGKSPFAPLQEHMEKVAHCVRMVPELFDHLGDQEHLEKITSKISKAEHEADLAKNDIRASLKGYLFLPVPKVRILEWLTLQDALADKAEDIAVLLTFRKLAIPEAMATLFEEFLKKNLKAFEAAFQIVSELTEILESTFGGAEAEKLRGMVDRVAYLEHEVDLVQRYLLKEIFNHEDAFTFATFHLWMRVIGEVGDLSNLSEKLANRILIAMEVK